MKNKKRLLILLFGMLALSGCTESNIFNGEAITGNEPDQGIYDDIILDQAQLQEDVRSAALDKADYPMALSLEFTMVEPGEMMDVTVVVKDDAAPEDVCWYAGEVLKIINDEASTQDFSIARSADEYYGGYIQERSVNLRVYHESQYPNGSPSIACEVPESSYVEFTP